jgi:hypothetical protein
MRLADPGPPPELALTVRPAEPTRGYQVWLYESVIDSVPLGRIPRDGGTARFALLETASDYRYIDIAFDSAGGFPGHSGQSVARVNINRALAELQGTGG